MALVNPGHQFQEVVGRWSRKMESIQAAEPTRKTSRAKVIVTVPQTDTGGWGEKPQVYERNFVKELGKTAAVI